VRISCADTGKTCAVFDMSAKNPQFCRTGDIDGCGDDELSICFYKTARLHNVPENRPQFYRFDGNTLHQMWMGSRLSRPFDDYDLIDIDDDGLAELVALERLQEGGHVTAVYRWQGFGFEFLYEIT